LQAFGEQHREDALAKKDKKSKKAEKKQARNVARKLIDSCIL